MKITRITSHVLGYDLPEPLGYSQQYYNKRTAHLVEVETDDGVVGWGECFGAGNIALANKGIVEKVIQPEEVFRQFASLCSFQFVFPPAFFQLILV